MPRKVNGHIADVTEKNIENILCTEEQRRRKNSRPYRIIARVTRACGTVGFLVANAAVFGGWVLVNELVVEFDPYPYTFLLFGVSLEAIFLSIFILISQSMADAENERRHHLDLQMNLLTEREMTALMRLTVQMAEKMGINDDATKEVRAFAHETDPSAVQMQIVDAEHRHHIDDVGEKNRARSSR